MALLELLHDGSGRARGRQHAVPVSLASKSLVAELRPAWACRAAGWSAPARSRQWSRSLPLRTWPSSVGMADMQQVDLSAHQVRQRPGLLSRGTVAQAHARNLLGLLARQMSHGAVT